MKEETDGGAGHDEEEDEWNRQIRQKRDKIEATTLQYYASQLNESLENRMEELTKKMEEIHTSSTEEMYTHNGDEHNQTEGMTLSKHDGQVERKNIEQGNMTNNQRKNHIGEQ
jgi:hypothetical protein